MASPPRPGKNSDGQTKKPNPADAAPSQTPAPPAGAVNPMTHPSAPGMQQQPIGPGQPALSHPQPAGNAPPQNAQPPTDPAGDAMAKQSRQAINFKDMPPPMQMQAEAQQGLDPMAPLKMLQSNVANTVAQGPSQGAVPNMLTGPGVPPGLEAFPDDLAHLHGLMQQGLGPGSSPQEHALGQNAQAIARAHVQQAEQNAQQTGQYAKNVQDLGGLMGNLSSQGALPAPQDVAAHVAATQVPPPGWQLPGFDPNSPQGAPGAPSGPPPAPPQLPPPGAGAGPPGPPVMGGPQMPPPGQADMGAPPAGPPQLGSNVAPPPAQPPIDPNAPGGIPPALIAALAKRKPKG